MAKKKCICFDLDGVICNQTAGNYEKAVVNKEMVVLINHLFDEGNRIIIHTSRFMGRNNGNIFTTYAQGYSFTLKQLKSWKVKFHELIMGKPCYDVLVDDRAVFFNNDWREIEREITC